MDTVRFEMDCDPSVSHFHTDMEILYLLSGRVTVILENMSVGLNPEDFVVFNPYEHHELVPETGSHMLSAYIPFALLREAGIETIHCCSRLHRQMADYFPLIRSKLATLYRNSADRSGERRLYVQSDAYGLLGILREHFSAAEAGGASVHSPTESLRDILRYTQAHFCEPISSQDAADAVFLSRSYMSKLFQRQMGVAFSDYLLNLRLNRALRLLMTSEQTVTDIAMACGFSTLDTFIVNFQKKYGQTPGAYRRASAGAARETPGTPEPAPLLMTRLLKHASYEERFHPLSKRPQAPVRLDVNAAAGGERFVPNYNDSISVGWAGALMQEGMRNAVRRAVKEIGFKSVTLLGILDDVMGVYYEMLDGTPALSFTYIDMILDFVLSTGAKPAPILSYMPSSLLGKQFTPFGSSYFAIPNDLDKWEFLVEGLLKHLVERYGMEELNTWRFPVYPGAYIDFDVFTMDEYFPFYQRTFQTIRRVLPEATVTGCQIDLDVADVNNFDTLRRFLERAKEAGCLPDILTFQLFHQKYEAGRVAETSQRSIAPAEREQGEIAPCNPDPDLVAHLVAGVRDVMAACGVENRPIQLIMWNSTMWQADCVNDTCYKSAFLVKNYLENNRGDLLLTYSALTDNNERRVLNSVSFHGGFGLMNYQGLPKAGYWAMVLLSRVKGSVVSRGRGYLVARSEDRKKLRICLYNFCPINPSRHITRPLTPDELHTFDRYYGFEEQGVLGFQIHINGLLEGRYNKETYSISRAQGSSYDNWMSMGAPAMLSPFQQEHLEKTSIPGYQYDQVTVKASGELVLSAVLDVLEVQVICLEKR